MDAHVSKWQAACACLSAESGDAFSIEDFERSKKIIQAWMESPKAFDAVLDQLPAQQKAMMKQLMGGGMGGMMGAMGGF